MSPHPAALPIAELLAACDVRRQKRSGPGGQHRNKVETAVVLTHRPSGASGQASERRSQAENLREAIFRLRLNLALQVRQPPDEAAGPSPLWRSRCRAGRIAVHPEHEDFPALLAEAMDVLWARGAETQAAAERLNVTASQLVKLVARAPRALAQLNAAREERGLPPLKSG